MLRTGSLLMQLITTPLLALSAMGETGGGTLPSKQADKEREAAGPQKLWVYVGTYTSPKTGSKGIYLFEMDTRSGELKKVGLAAEVASPSFLAIHPSRRFLYAVGELHEFQGKKSGAVSAFALDAATGKLTPLNQQPSGGQGPCFVTVEPNGKYLLTANYTSGTVGVLPIDKDGRLGEPVAVAQHKGSGPNPKRQEGPHAHSVNLDPAGRYALAADLGVDKVFISKFGTADGSLTPNDPPAISVAPGAGPRHLAFDPSGHHAYVINEMASTVTAFTYDADRGALNEIQTISTLPAGFSEITNTAEVQVHPSGRFLYGSNRGHDSIAIFTIDEKTGRLTAVGHEPTQGKAPRNFAIDPSGAWMLAANQNSNSLVVFRIDQETGKLKATGTTVEAPSPVCIKFVPVNR
jgi:6-phosphogluconolactonase